MRVSALVLALVAAAWLPARAQDEKPTAKILDAVVKLHTQVPREARTAPYLGTEREGSGVLIDSDGLILTIGYLITEAMAVDVTGPGGKHVPATVVGFDSESGLGLVRATVPLDAKPIALGRPEQLKEKQPVLIATGGGAEEALGAYVVSRRPFAGYWEYYLDNAIFTSPPHLNWGGAALIGPDGKLLGVGSLMVPDAAPGDGALPGNMFVPVDTLKPAMADLIATGRPAGPARPWLGLNAQEVKGKLVVTRVSPEGPADKAGVRRGDIIASIAGQPVSELGAFYKKLWSLGSAGIEVPLTLGHTGDSRDVKVQTIDRYKYLKLDVTY